MENKEFTEKQKNDYKELLSSLSSEIKDKSKENKEVVQIDKNLDALSLKLDKLNTQEQANDFLDDVKKELQALKEYGEYKELSENLEQKVEDFEKQTTNIAKKQLGDLQKNIYKTNPDLTKDQIVAKANQGRKTAEKEVSGIVGKLAKKEGWIGKLAKKAEGLKDSTQ